ncbi:N-6 DNA methylase [Falsihalocynthiibacter sp. BN13B15]|uniref:N-6 DNA methylase n=1 Tax=Falsihalocynthiibacter sp. BN13B15 TaxID=3240871 RepID=UPI0035102989
MNFKENETAQKLAGAYYTPKNIAAFLANWVADIQPNKVLEPSCGDGAFMEALSSLCSMSSSTKVSAIDIDPVALASVREKSSRGQFGQLKVECVQQDFLTFSQGAIETGTRFDAVMGNPPFIRYQYLDAEHQAATEEIFRDAGLKFTKHTNAWVPFVVQSIRLLRSGGRLGMVIPSELMHVIHAGSLRSFLRKECENVAVVHLEELFSSEVLQGVVLLLATKAGKSDMKCADIAFPSAKSGDLVNGCASAFQNNLPYISSIDLGEKWMEGLLTPDELKVYSKAQKLSQVFRFTELAKAEVGIVTGANKFFLVPDATVTEYGLHEFSKPMFGRSSHVKGVVIAKENLVENARAGLPTNFLHFPKISKDQFPLNVRRYIESGEKDELHKRFKCRIREPWYVVPSVWAAEVAMLKRAHDTPRIILNDARAYTTDTAYRITIKDPKVVSAQCLVASFVNSLTALSAELEGRHYGGGVIELVPSEIKRLVIPVSTNSLDTLSELDGMYRKGIKATEIMRQRDAIILSEVGLTQEEQDTLHIAWKRLKNRRQRN